MSTRFSIAIELYQLPGTPAPDAAALQAEVERGLAGFWPALGLPAEPAVTLHLSNEPAGLFDFSIYLDGQWAPSPVVYRSHPPAPPGIRILRAIFDRRTQLINDEQLRLLRRECLDMGKIAPAWSSAPLELWRRMAALLLQNGFSLHRLSACFEHWNPEKSVEEAFERLIENPETLTLTLVVHPGLEKAHTDADPGWQTLFPAFYQEIYQELGVLLPKVRIETADELPFDRFLLRLNDLWVPVLPGLKAGQALYEAPTGEIFMPFSGRYFSTSPPASNAPPVFAGPWACLLDWVRYWVTNCAGWYVNTGIVDARLDTLEETNRALIVMTREQWPTHRLCTVLRLLLREWVSIRNLPEILDVLLRIEGRLAVDDVQYRTYFPPVNRVVVVSPGTPPAPTDDKQLAGQVRASLKYPVAFPFMDGGVLPCFTLDAGILSDFREGFFRDALPMPGTVFYRLLQALYEKTGAGQQRPVVLTPASVRYAVYEVLQPYFPGLAVLSVDEVPPFFKPEIKAVIQLS